MNYDLATIDETINDNRKGSEVGKIIIKIRETVFSLQSKEEITIYVQNHQRALIKQKESSIQSARFDEILFYLETYFWNHLDGSLPISDLGKEALSQRFQTSIDHCSSILFSASGIFTNQIQKELLESVSKTFKAKKAETIAFGSIYNKYYNIEDKTKEITTLKLT